MTSAARNLLHIHEPAEQMRPHDSLVDIERALEPSLSVRSSDGSSVGTVTDIGYVGYRASSIVVGGLGRTVLVPIGGIARIDDGTIVLAIDSAQVLSLPSMDL